jgi:hypothetical protein
MSELEPRAPADLPALTGEIVRHGPKPSHKREASLHPTTYFGGADITTWDLPDLAKEIRKQFDRGVAATNDAVRARLAIGGLLNEARSRMPGDTEFGRWVAEQKFPWSRQWSFVLMQGARLEPYMLAAVTTQVDSGRTNFRTALVAAKKLAVDAGDWDAPAPKVVPEADIPDPESALALRALLKAAGPFLAISDQAWLEISTSERLIAGEFFKKLSTRMVEVHALWTAADG